MPTDDRLPAPAIPTNDGEQDFVPSVRAVDIPVPALRLVGLASEPVYEALERRWVRYANRLPANDVLERQIEDLL